jgi:hypothetical protein
MRLIVGQLRLFVVTLITLVLVIRPITTLATDALIEIDWSQRIHYSVFFVFLSKEFARC